MTVVSGRLVNMRRDALFLVLILLSCCTIHASVEAPATECEVNESGECIIATEDECKNYGEDCLQGASIGKCAATGSEEFQRMCPKACRICHSCEDEQPESCPGWARMGECDANPKYMLIYCSKSCNICDVKQDITKLIDTRVQVLLEKDVDKTPYGIEQLLQNDAHRELHEKVKDYLDNTVRVDPKFDSVREHCKMRNKDCVIWAERGECEKTRDYMITNCAPACQTCELLDFSARCPYDPNEATALNPGDLQKLFERLVEMKDLEPKVLSMPNSTSLDVFDGPWVVTFDKFLSDEECDRLIELGGHEGYLESADVGKKKFDGTYDKSVNNGRTSTNAWCQNDCEKDPVTVAVVKRMEDMLNIPEQNFEYLQLLKYEVGQFYQQHHDYINFHAERKQGVRSLTVFLYLNDVEAGGGTNFPKLGNLTVMPKRGKAVIWPSVKNEAPNIKDPRTDHQALPVEKGIKYGANAWIHQRDFKEPFSRACI